MKEGINMDDMTASRVRLLLSDNITYRTATHKAYEALLQRIKELPDGTDECRQEAEQEDATKPGISETLDDIESREDFTQANVAGSQDFGYTS
jgi:hypothetical protein